MQWCLQLAALEYSPWHSKFCIMSNFLHKIQHSQSHYDYDECMSTAFFAEQKLIYVVFRATVADMYDHTLNYTGMNPVYLFWQKTARQ